MMIYMVLFFTHSGAIKFQRKCQKMANPCELMPVPRALSSNCSISAKVTSQESLEDLINEDIEKIYSIVDNDYNLLYESE